MGLRLTLDATGRVTDAEVNEPAGHGFDEAASSAALRFVFEPARRGGAPIASRIPYTHVFEPAAPAELEPTLPPASPPPALPDAPVASTLPAAAASARLTPPERAVEVTVNQLGAARELEASAQAVRVIETERAQRQSADLGEVLARSEGVGVRRSGGLGTTARFSLNGLTDDQIRFSMLYRSSSPAILLESPTCRSIRWNVGPRLDSSTTIIETEIHIKNPAVFSDPEAQLRSSAQLHAKSMFHRWYGKPRLVTSELAFSTRRQTHAHDAWIRSARRR